MAKIRLKVPKTAARGDIIEIKTMIDHAMESGRRKDEAGNLIPRRIINRFTCTYGGEEVFSADLMPGISANPFLTFHLVATASGPIEFAWHDDDGSIYTEMARIEVG